MTQYRVVNQPLGDDTEKLTNHLGMTQYRVVNQPLDDDTV